MGVFREVSLLFCLSVCLVSFPFESFSSELGPDELKHMALQIPNELVHSGILSVGHLDLQAMVKEIDGLTMIGCYRSIRDFEPAEGIPQGLVKERSSGRYDLKGRAYIFLGENVGQVFGSKKFTLLVLHETLKTAGYLDSNYSISIALAKLAWERDFESLVRNQTIFDQRFAYVPLKRGGGGGVGVGGGDADGIAIKYELLARFDELVGLFSEEMRERMTMLSEDFLLKLIFDLDLEVFERIDRIPFFRVSANGRSLRINRYWWTTVTDEREKTEILALALETVFSRIESLR
jgi:hypothetical protein